MVAKSGQKTNLKEPLGAGSNRATFGVQMQREDLP
jgi:hypothetical protein